MTTPERFPLAGVMGWPVMHSRSPLIHNHWFQVHGLKGAYVPLLIEPGRVEAALRALPALGFAGVNVTIPHKQEAMRVVDELDESAQRIGAISCITVRADGSLHGCNNDAFGFIRNLRQAQPGWQPANGPVVVLGAGGGARAVCWGLLQEGVPEVRLVNRTFERAQALVQALSGGGAPDAAARGRFVAHRWADRHEVLAGATLVVNTTSPGMVGQPALDFDMTKMPAGAVAADIVYIPGETPFLAQARQRGHATVRGLGMLLHQGPLAWKRWFGIEPQVTPELWRLVEASL
jgi:shikimate dehydrogenase